MRARTLNSHNEFGHCEVGLASLSHCSYCLSDMTLINPNPKNRVTFIGSLPPPFSGRTVMTQVVVDSLRNNGPIRCYDWSLGKPLQGVKLKLVRLWGATISILKVLFGSKHEKEVIYYPVSSDWGQLFDISIVVAARLRGYQTVLHHHVYSYIDKYDWRMAMTNRMLGKSGAHVVHCELMKQDLQARYSTEAQFLIVPPTIVSQEQNVTSRSTHEMFTLGFMSNLTIEKGLGHAIDTFEQLTESGYEVALVLAGPCKGRAEQSLIDRALAKWPQRIEYRGAVYEEAKKQFFADIDVFLFPTEYANESWGIVLTEALVTKCPVITYSRGCIPWIVQGGCGLVIEPEASFVELASELISRWIDDSEEHQRVCQLAGDRAELLNQESKRQFKTFLEDVRQLQS